MEPVNVLLATDGGINTMTCPVLDCCSKHSPGSKGTPTKQETDMFHTYSVNYSAVLLQQKLGMGRHSLVSPLRMEVIKNGRGSLTMLVNSPVKVRRRRQ
eukprot:11978453-Ditylum_brightwellii.AAC.1